MFAGQDRTAARRERAGYKKSSGGGGNGGRTRVQILAASPPLTPPPCRRGRAMPFYLCFPRGTARRAWSKFNKLDKMT